MKKRLFYLPLVALVLSGCSFDPLGWFSKGKEDDNPIKLNPTGGTADEREAIKTACNGSVAMKSPSTSITPMSTPTLEEDAGDFIKLEKTKVAKVNKTAYTVQLEWYVDQTQAYFKSFVGNQGNTNMLYVNYKGWEHKSETGELKFRLKKATCGGASVENPDTMQYTCKIKNAQKFVDNLTIAQINKVNGEKTITAGTSQYVFESTFDMVNYEFKQGEKYSPYFKIHENNANVESAYYYCNVNGKVLYTAPDGNWALIADGDQVLEVYAGSGTALTEANFPYLKKGNYVTVTGNLSQYCGNIQLGFVTGIKELTDHSKIAEPSGQFAEMTEAKIVSLKSSSNPQYHKNAIDQFSNSLGKVTGTIVDGSLKDRNDAAATAANLENNRFTFDVKVGNEILKVAYDYHTDKDKSVGLFNALVAKLGTPGASVTIKGTMRYSGNNNSPFLNPNGVWTIVPYEAAHVA